MRLKELYLKRVIPAMQEKFGYKNKLAVPHLEKVAVNAGVGRGREDAKFIEAVKESLTKITGQRPRETKARKSIAGFKIRQGMTIGLAVTLRGPRMYDFVDKIINVVLPRTRDFRGLALKSLDERGNLTIGFREHLAFPEIDPDEVEKIHGLEVTIVSTAKNRDEASELFKLLGFPFREA